MSRIRIECFGLTFQESKKLIAYLQKVRGVDRVQLEIPLFVSGEAPADLRAAIPGLSLSVHMGKHLADPADAFRDFGGTLQRSLVNWLTLPGGSDNPVNIALYEPDDSLIGRIERNPQT